MRVDDKLKHVGHSRANALVPEPGDLSADPAYLLRHVKRYILIYGLCGGILIAVLKFVEYRFLVVQHSVEIYGGLIALVFAGLGIWLGLRLTKNKEVVVVKEVPVPAAGLFALNKERLRESAITKRELEILELIAKGMSNREIAEKLFVSESTVKTHSSRLFDKLSADRQGTWLDPLKRQEQEADGRRQERSQKYGGRGSKD